MEASTIAWTLFVVYLLITAILAWQGGRRTSGGAGFAVGSGRMNPLMAGMTLGACLASSAMFVIMPGFVYSEGLPALVGFSLPLVLGVATGLWLLAPRFQALGAASGALTVPHWIGNRYCSAALRRLFAVLHILQLAYLVLVTVGCAYVMSSTLGLPYEACVVGIVVFVFGYTAFGGAWAHALTNSVQGAIMLVVALLIFCAGWQHWESGALVQTLAESGWTAPESKLFSSSWEVWGVPFVMGAALTTQPHLITKALYVEGRRNLAITIGVGVLTFGVFSLVLFGGAYARLDLAPGLAQDAIMGTWLASAFPWPALGALVSVAILAASMSTLDGLLVATAATLANDVAPGRGGLWLNRVVLLALGLGTIALALSPPSLVLILGQLGVYGLVAASAGPLVAGLVHRGEVRALGAWAGALSALVLHFTLSLGGLTGNPGVAAIVAMAVGVPVSLLLGRPALRGGAVESAHEAVGMAS